MTIEEQIAVMDAFRNGFCIDSRLKSPPGVVKSCWCCNESPGWDWVNYEYRVRPVPKITRQNLIDDIITVCRNAENRMLAANHRHVTGSQVFWDEDEFSEN